MADADRQAGMSVHPIDPPAKTAGEFVFADGTAAEHVQLKHALHLSHVLRWLDPARLHIASSVAHDRQRLVRGVVFGVLLALPLWILIGVVLWMQ